MSALPIRSWFYLWPLLLASPSASAQALRCVDSDPATGTSAAVVVEDLPLVYTAQLLPLDREGRIVGKGDVVAQTEKLLDDVIAVARAAGSDANHLVRLHIYVAKDDMTPEAHKVLARRFRDHRPAATFVTTRLPHADAAVALDAIAVAPKLRLGAVKHVRVEGLHGAGWHAAIQPPGARVYIAGQAEKGADLAEATRKTLDSLKATLRWLGLGEKHVVEVKAFQPPMTGADVVHREVGRALGGGTAPPLSLVEWQSSLPIEIELIAWAGAARPGLVLDYLTPPGMKASPVYSRVTRINHGRSIYISGLHAAAGKTTDDEIVSLFTTLGRLLDRTGSDFRHLAKATYYVSADEGRKGLGAIRPRYYDPNRPPAASLAQVAGVGAAGGRVTLDMIAVPEPVRGINEHGGAEFGHGLTPAQAAAGWISLFDGKTTFGWDGAKIDDRGALTGGTTTTTFGPCEIRADFARGGSITIAGERLKADPGPFVHSAKRGRSSIRLEERAAVRTLIVQPQGLDTILGGKELAGWKRVDHPKLPAERHPRWEYRDGVLHALGGPGAMEYELRRYGDLVLQAEVRTRGRHVNGGLFFRSIPGDFMNGYEAQVYNRCDNGDVSVPSKWSSGGIDDRQNARRLVSRDGEPFLMTVIAQGNHIATWVNGYQQTDWLDTRPPDANPRRGLRTEPGTLQLQAHDAETDLEFRMVRVRSDSK